MACGANTISVGMQTLLLTNGKIFVCALGPLFLILYLYFSRYDICMTHHPFLANLKRFNIPLLLSIIFELTSLFCVLLKKYSIKYPNN